MNMQAGICSSRNGCGFGWIGELIEKCSRHL
jgi:hypothetical protein